MKKYVIANGDKDGKFFAYTIENINPYRAMGAPHYDTLANAKVFDSLEEAQRVAEKHGDIVVDRDSSVLSS